ncbi:MAG: ABC transporter permease [Caldilineaceae bacterium SB0675_bin_29]|uniref:ABC transporter permease n=1 Tax=Caldilineaceae bacterium SB0675_bin_29 TaxID=2605266 RepID=A0A6B1G4Q0_9CHLR|nr:ABC transporter permease [Caldilineaceae bacterium SB0675_bin_29]
MAVTDAKTLPPETVSSGAALVEVESSVSVASQWQLMWWKFRKHRMAMVGGVVTLIIYAIAIFVEFLSPSSPGVIRADYTWAPPQRLHFLRQTEQGLRWDPYVNGYKVEIDPEALKRTFVIDEEQIVDIGFFVRGEPYKMWGLWESDLHLVGSTDAEVPVYFLGADRMGRDLLSSMIYGTRVSMSIGLLGVFLSFFLGILLGGISGFYGGTTDNLIQRIIEFIRSIPTIPLWMGLAAALPTDWPPLRIYFGITIILSFIGWTGLARVVRGRFLSLRTEDFVMAARLDGASELTTIWRHMVPSFFSHIIASLTLSIPGMILAETSLSFLGLGLRRPVVSWGVLLQEAQNIRSVATAPWLLIPGLAVLVAVLALNFLGDGLRDAADPYNR